MLWFLVLPLIVSPICAARKIICVRPTDPPHVQCDCPSQTDCSTLDEWTRVGSNPFTSNTTVVLLPGIHLINSTKNKLLIRNIHSLVLTGGHGNNINAPIATVTCTQNLNFALNFINCNHISISTVVFNSCALIFSIINNAHLINLSVINSRLIITQILRTREKVLGQYGTVDDEKPCKFHDDFDIINSTFQNSRISMQVDAQVLNTPSYTSCTQLSLKGVVFKEMKESNIIMKAYNVVLTNVTIYNCSHRGGLVIVFSVHKLTLWNVKIVNNSDFGFILDLQGINTVKFAGDFILKYNHGAHGIALRQVKKVLIATNSTFKLEKNLCRLYLFLFEGDPELFSKLYINKGTTLIFEDNYVKGSVMRLDIVNLHAYNSKIIFRKNKSLQTESISSTIIPNAVLFLWNSECSFSRQSALNFSHNTAVLSGGITLFNSTIQFVTTTIIYFEYNEGGDGGGMAFYEKSCIRRQQKNKLNNETIDIHFYYNKARGRGGAIFVQDNDYIEGLTGYQYGYFVSTPTFQSYSPKIHLHFRHNVAKVSGNDLYGGRIDSRQIRDVFLLSWVPASTNDSRYAIASDPIRICMCKASFPMCNGTNYSVTVFPGQTFQILVVAVGQRKGIVPSVVTAELSDNEGSLGEGQDIQGAGRECTSLEFAIFSQKKSKRLNLKVRDIGFQNLKNLHRLLEDSEYHLLTQQFSANIKLQKCPLGFLFKETTKTCLCLQSINLHSGVHCNYDTFSISKAKHKWIAATFEHNDTQYHGVIIYDQCPYDYCQTDPDSLSFIWSFQMTSVHLIIQEFFVEHVRQTSVVCSEHQGVSNVQIFHSLL